MIKVWLDYSNGKYSATLLEDHEVKHYEQLGHCVVAIPESKAVEWGEMLNKMDQWHVFWNNLSSKWYKNQENKRQK